MSQENVEVVRSAIEAWNRLDLDAFMTVCIPKPSGGQPSPRAPKEREASSAATTGFARHGTTFGQPGPFTKWSRRTSGWLGDSLLVLGRDPCSRRGERDRDRLRLECRASLPRRQGHQRFGLARPQACPRSRGAVGVARCRPRRGWRGRADDLASRSRVEGMLVVSPGIRTVAAAEACPLAPREYGWEFAAALSETAGVAFCRERR